MAENGQVDDGGNATVDAFREYVQRAGSLLSGVESERIEEFLSESTSRAAVQTFVTGEDSTFILECSSPIKVKGGGDDEKKSGGGGDSSTTQTSFGCFSEIPPSVFDTNSSDTDKIYLLFMKQNDVGPLSDDKSIPSQIIISKFNPSQPFSTMIPYIRHTFVPIATLRAQKEEKQSQSTSRGILNNNTNRKPQNQSSAIKGILEKLRDLELKLLESQDEAKLPDVALEPIPEISKWLEGLNDTDKQAIVDSHTKGKSIDIVIPQYLKEQAVLNTMLKRLKLWKDDITNVVRRNRSSQGRLNTVQQEIKFWRAKMSAIEQVEKQLKTDGVCASTLVLMKNNYVVQARAFSNQLQIKESKKEVALHNEVLNTFPIKVLVTSSSVQDIIKAINEIFQHLDAFKLKNNYPVERIAILARAAARDVSNQLRDVLSRDIMIMKYSLFVQRTSSTERLFHNFQNKYTKLRSDLRQRELLENRQRNFSGPWHRDQETDLNHLQKRVESIKNIRKGHAEIEKVIDSTFASTTDKETLQEEINKISEAYNVFRKLDVLKAPIYEWEQCVQEYESKIQEVENEIQAMIRLAMENANGPREMFRVCEKYNKLFVRPRIRNAVWEFQEELLKNVHEEVKQLQLRYRKKFKKIPASRLSLLRDIPAVSGEVIWCKQLKRQLDQNEKRLEAVLGENWKNRANAKDLAEQMNSFAKKLDPMILVKQWENDAKSLPNFDDQAPIFKIDRGVNKSLSLNVAFDENYVKLFKEVRCLLSLGIRIDISLRLSCIDVKQKYPIAVKLKEAVSIFTRTCIEIDQYSSQSVGGGVGGIAGGSTDNKQDEEEQDDAKRDANKTMLSQLTTLVDQYKHNCQQQILDGAKHRWQNHEKQLNKYVASLSKATISLQDKTQKAYDLSYDCDKILQELIVCPLVAANMTAKIEKLQKIVNKLDDGGFYGVPYWTAILNEKLERILLKRVDEILDGWLKTLDEDWDIMKSRLNDNEDDDGDDENIFLRKEPIKHTIKITNNVLQVQPPINDAKMLLGQDLQSLLSMVVSQPRPKSDQPNDDDDDDDDSKNTFKAILNHINTDKIIECYRKIEEITFAASEYANTWLSYQALYDMDLNKVFEELGDDIGKWKKLLIDMKNSAGSFDSTDMEKSFGPIVIHYGSVRNKVDEKYRNFRQQTFKALKLRLGNLLREFHTKATRGKHELEETSFDTSTTKEIVSAITSLQNLKDESSGWDELWTECEAAEKLLVNNRYSLGNSWMYASRIRGVLDDFFQVLQMRWNALKQEAEAIYSKLEARNDTISESVTKLEEKWHAEKPTGGWASTWTDEEVVDWLKEYEGGLLRPIIENFRSKSADGRILYAISKLEGARLKNQLVRLLEIQNEVQQNNLVNALQTLLFTHSDVHAKLSQFDNQIKQIEEAYAEIKIAKNAMKIVVDAMPGDDDGNIESMLDSIKKEMEGLSEVHRALTVQWEKLQKIGKDQFMRLDTRELGKTLRGMEEELGKLPNKMKSYQVYHKFIEIIKSKKKMNKNVLGDLNAGGIEAPILRQKHWRELFALLGIRKSNPNQLIVEDLWSINLLKYLNEIREICLVAQGENALENFLAELNEKWQETLFELVDYKGKCSLVKNWNDLMADIADALSDVMSMKQSPYYKSFERDAVQWEEKLNSATAIFDVMVDVQRRWVYLQGVFTNSEDVKRQLGGFYQKFKAFDREFIQLMKGIKSEPLVDRWVTPEEGLLAKLEANQNTLNQIQKALNEYLESQRAQFARFYFIGDDDLLEIIGNARDPIQMNRHLSKMFAGITQLQLLPDNESVVIGMVSKEGESVKFKEAVDVEKSPKIQDWLTKVEMQMRVSLASLLESAIETFPPPSKPDDFFAWCRRYPAQVALLATQVRWSEAVEKNLKRLSTDQSDESHEDMVKLLQLIKDTLTILADRVLMNIPAAIRKLYEQLITECVYQRDVTRNLIKMRICSEKDFKWLYRMRFYWNKNEKDVLKKLEIRISRAKFYYGFEYFGATERLVQTPLTDKAYLTLCEALHAKLGGNPFGPAGTGKTESVKALGAQLGRFVLVFCCDETFDYAAMSRIFVGLCQCGAWGCFDEFNRLEEKILSAVSQQILTIQTGLKTNAPTILVREQTVKLDQNMGIFVTMNPGYAGRSELPDNLKQLFRGMAMIKPNRVLIAQVMLFSQGFGAAELLSSKIVLLFELCRDQLSKQSHYDFGLRALKSVLRSAGNLKRSEQLLKREALKSQQEDLKDNNDDDNDDEKGGGGNNQLMTPKEEETILIRSLMSTVVPKLVMNDKFLFDSLLDSAFPGADIQGFKEEQLKAAIKEVAKTKYLRVDEQWLVKLMQFHTIQNITHGVMLVGPSGAGKSAARNTLLEAMEKVDGIKSEQYEIDPKAINKEELYGILDPTTLEWTDGVFTSTLRMIIDNVRGESNKRHWIVFDGDVDPEWAENLNSVLDDNKMLTLPNGERLSLTPNIRIIFETPTLFYATPATVSRCGMVWFSTECVSTEMLYDHMLLKLEHTQIDQAPNRAYKDWEEICGDMVSYIRPFFMDEGGLVTKTLEWAETKKHVMKFTRTKAIYSLFSQLRGGIVNILDYNENTEYPLNEDQMKSYYGKFLVYAMLWAFGGPMKLELRYEFGKEIINVCGYMDTGIEMPDGEILIDYEVNIEEQSWQPWSNRVNNPELEPHNIKDPTVVIGTIDTIRHESVIGSWLNDLKPVILCGPPGSGKSMTLSAVLRANPQYEMITLNFSSTAGTELIFKAFEQYCKIERKNQGYVIRPTFQNKILVIFCDEINLPAEDLYGTQTIITFVRQLICKGGYWHPVNKNWIQLENIQFVGACNPPTDAGRVVLSPRFLNNCPLILVDFPGRESLLEIYGTFIRALLKLTPSIRQMADNVTTAMVDVYQNSQKRFNTDIQAHYVYSPRELSRWTRAMFRALEYLEDVGGTTAEEIIRLWAHEALRLFSDRLVDPEERKWTRDMIHEVANNLFSGCDLGKALEEPILYSDYLSGKNYVSVEKHALKDYILQRLKVFNEEELDVQLVIYDELLDHILRIDRVLRQPLGHLLMVGASGAGKTVFSRFVSWMNGMTTFQIKVHKDYGAEDFDIDLRNVLIQSGVEQKKMTFIFDESNILDTAFLERMNALLASGEVPGLFEDAEYMQLIMKLREAARKDGLIIDTEEELYQMFTTHVQNNLHIVFTMNPAGGDFSDRAATSPALFNRCVINWWGTWPEDALLQVAGEFTETCDLNIGVPPELRVEPPEQKNPTDDEEIAEEKELIGVHLSVSKTIVQFHQMVEKVMEYLANNMVRSTFVTPRHYLDLIHHFVALFDEKRQQLEDQQKHLNTGLKALKETEDEVARRQVELDAQSKELAEQQKNAKLTLEQMMEAEKTATKSREEAIRVQGEVDEEMKAINERTETVESELAEAKPALEAAQKAVSNINKKQLNEIKNLRNPPKMVAITMSAVTTLMGKKTKDWKGMQKLLGANDFVPSILKFDTNKVKEKTRKKVMKEFISMEDFTFERVNKASKVAGPLVLWVKSQVKFAHLLDQVEPMTKEIKELKDKLQKKQKQAEELKKQVAKLEKEIEEYKAEYQRMVQKITELKNEMAIVEESMARARKLLEDLSDENSRWQAETESFQKQLSTLDGDCLLAAGFLTYIGFYSQTFRQILVAKWKEILEENGLPYNENLDLVLYLSQPAELIAWKAAYLPEDDLCVENAIILKRFNRYPLVIDPSGQATKFLMANYKKQKIVRTSFLDSAFNKNLESGLRFGNALLIEDVENMDPILNPVLNKEYQTVGGRRLVKLANKDIDFSPTFTMFLVTRDPASAFTPDLCSRVTFVNFSVTPSSLQSQCLNKVLKVEAPDIEKKRNDQLRLQGEFKFQLRELEDQLLNALNSVTGNILDDANLMSTLENLKLKAKVISEKAEETEKVLAQVEEASFFYTPFAKACSKLYFSLENLANVHFLYQFDLRYFLTMCDFVLVNGKRNNLPELEDIGDEKAESKARLVPLMKALHRVTYIRTKRALKVNDHAAWGLRVAQVFIDSHPDTDFTIKDEYLQYILKGKGFKNSQSVKGQIAKQLELTSIGQSLLGALYSLSGFENIKDDIEMNIEEWKNYKGGPAEAQVPNDWNTGESSTPYQMALEAMVIQKPFRPDQMIRSANSFIESVFGWNLAEFEANADSLRHIVEKQIDEDTPILMASTPGNDPSAKIDAVASEVFESGMSRKYQSFALGSPKDYEKADNAITQATKKGTWVCLKNVHLSPGWLQTLEKRLHRLKKDPGFRLFMTMEIHPKVPVTLLRKSSIIIYEPPLGIKASLQRTFNTVDGERVDRAPEERSRLYILLAWLHAVILERLRFCPIGWSKAFEFSETDLLCAMEAMDEWIDKITKSRSNIDPNEIPWDALHKMLVQYVYGGRVDNKYDTARLESFVENLFNPEAFNEKFALASLCKADDEKSGGDNDVGRLGYVCPNINGKKIEREQLARVVQIDGNKLKIVFLETYIVIGKERINLNNEENWIESSQFRTQDIMMEPVVIVPPKTKYQDVRKWVLEIDEVTVSNPAIVGLPPRAELMILAQRATTMCQQLLSLQDIETGNAQEELNEILNRAKDGDDDGVGAVPQWMKELRERSSRWLEDIPQSMKKLIEKSDSIKNPLFRFMRREFTIGKKVLNLINSGLDNLVKFVDGEIKATNDLRQLVQELSKEQIPKRWNLYTMEKLGVGHWIMDFVKRIEQLDEIAQEDYVTTPKPCRWLGGLFSPAGFIAATRQYVAQLNQWPLESLILCVEIGESEWKPNSFIFEGVTLYGAGFDKQTGCMILTEKTQTPLPPSRFIWRNDDKEGISKSREWNDKAPDIVNVSIPVYLNKSFLNLLFDVSLPVKSALPVETWVQRAVSLSVWSN